MKIAEFFESKEIALPKGGAENANCTFDRFLAGLFRGYIAHVKTLDDLEFAGICEEAKKSVGSIRLLSTGIVAAVKHYLQGFPHLAYQEFESAIRVAQIDKLITNLSGYTPGPGGPFDNHLECTLHPPMYRLRADRTSAATGTLSRKDIFHVPFEKRRVVRNQRYSIAGLPSLYLGSSIWIAWEELGRPDLGSTFVSRFRFAETTSILDFQLPPLWAWKLHEYVLRQSKVSPTPPRLDELQERYDSGFIASYISLWPLIAACSIRVDSREGSFFPQYIVPQLLLQWVMNERKVDGIRYFSTRSLIADPYVNSNLVFPAREIGFKGCCSYLRRKFHLTAPIPWEILELYEPRGGFIMGPSNALGGVKLSDDLLVSYSNTGFHIAEARLGQIEREPGKSGPVED